MSTLKQVSMQETNEERFSRKHIDRYIREEIQASEYMQDKIDQGVQLLEEYRSKTYSYESKNLRMEQFRDIELRPLVEEIYVGIAYFQKPELYSSVVPQLAGRLGFDDKRAAATTIAEVIAVLCMTDAFDIDKPSAMASLTVKSRIPLSDKLIEYINHSAYLPPMVCEPNELKNNYDSGYLTHRDSLILGKGNHHSRDICLDVLNTMNKVALKLDVEFLSTVEEEPTFDFYKPKNNGGVTEVDVSQRKKLWREFLEQSYYFYALLVSQGNKIYMTHKVDKRGRIYSQGYHINPQGTSFKKAMIELHEEELVTGVPSL